MDLPPYLHPQDDGWRLEDAVSIWLLVHYGINRSDPDTPEICRLRLQARREVVTLASELPDQLKSPPVYVRRVHRDWGGATDQWPRQSRNSTPPPPPRTWVTTTALAGLCRQCGHVPPWEQQPPLATLHPALVPQETLALGADEGELATGGRPSTNAGAYAYIDSLLAKGSGKAAAYQNAASKFPSPGIDHDTRANQLASGYRQRNRNHRNKAHKPL